MLQLANLHASKGKELQQYNVWKKIEEIMKKITPIHEDVDNENEINFDSLIDMI